MIKYNYKNQLLTGIYQIRNILNDNTYIGSASSSFRNRKLSHFSLLKTNKHWNNQLQNATITYGLENFVFEIIEICGKEACSDREVFFISLYNPIYNYNKIMPSGKIGRSLSTQEKLAISKHHKNKKITKETREKISKANKGISRGKGKILNEDTKSKISLANKGRKQTEEEKLNRSVKLKGRVINENTKNAIRLSSSKKVYQYSINKEFISEYSSVISCGNTLDLSIEMIYRKIKQNLPYKGFIFTYLKL